MRHHTHKKLYTQGTIHTKKDTHKTRSYKTQALAPREYEGHEWRGAERREWQGADSVCMARRNCPASRRRVGQGWMGKDRVGWGVMRRHAWAVMQGQRPACRQAGVVAPPSRTSAPCDMVRRVSVFSRLVLHAHTGCWCLVFPCVFPRLVMHTHTPTCIYSHLIHPHPKHTNDVFLFAVCAWMDARDAGPGSVLIAVGC
jgi:hypothetical protein